MRIITRRISAGVDLKQAIANVVNEEGLQASIILSAVGGLSKACVRMPGAKDTSDGVRALEGPFEIISLAGIPQGTMHLHISFSDKEGNVFGGHLKDGCIIRQTLELVLLEDESSVYTREFEPGSNFNELVVRSRGVDT